MTSFIVQETTKISLTVSGFTQIVEHKVWLCSSYSVIDLHHIYKTMKEKPLIVWTDTMLL